MRYLVLQVSFRRRATNSRALLRNETYKDKAFCASSPPCIKQRNHYVKGDEVFLEVHCKGKDGNSKSPMYLMYTPKERIHPQRRPHIRQKDHISIKETINPQMKLASSGEKTKF